MINLIFSNNLADTLSKRKTIDLRDLRRLEARHRMKVKGKIRRDEEQRDMYVRAVSVLDFLSRTLNIGKNICFANEWQ